MSVRFNANTAQFRPRITVQNGVEVQRPSIVMAIIGLVGLAFAVLTAYLSVRQIIILVTNPAEGDTTGILVVVIATLLLVVLFGWVLYAAFTMKMIDQVDQITVKGMRGPQQSLNYSDIATYDYGSSPTQLVVIDSQGQKITLDCKFFRPRNCFAALFAMAQAGRWNPVGSPGYQVELQRLQEFQTAYLG